MKNLETKKTMKGQLGSMEAIIGALVVCAISLIVGVYVIVTVGSQFAPSGSTNIAVNNTVGNTTGMFATISPLLVIVGIVGFVVIILGFVKLLGYGGQGRTV